LTVSATSRQTTDRAQDRTIRSPAGNERACRLPCAPSEIGPDRGDDASLGQVREGSLAPDPDQTRPTHDSDDAIDLPPVTGKRPGTGDA